MSNEVKKYNLTIFGSVYTFVSDEPEHSIMQAAREIDAIMHQIATKVPGASREKIAIYAALRYALDYSNAHNSARKTTTDALQSMLALANTVLQ